MSRTFSTSSIQREVIQAKGQSGSNQKSAVSLCHAWHNQLGRSRHSPQSSEQ